MLSFRLKSTATLWKAPPKQTLYMRLTTITNNIILDTRSINRDPKKLDADRMIMLDMLFTAHDINMYLESTQRDEKINCEKMANDIYDMIYMHINHKAHNMHPTTCTTLYDHIFTVIKPYLDLAPDEPLQTLQP